jgi:hypothetical protein
MSPYRLKVSQVVEALRKTDGMVYLAAEKLRVAPKTVYRYANRHPIIREVIEEERGRMLDDGERALKRAVLAGEGWAVCFLLKTLGKHRGYVDRQEIDAIVSTTNSDAPIIRTVAALTGGSGGDLSPSGEGEDAIDGTPVGENDSRSLARHNGSGGR